MNTLYPFQEESLQVLLKRKHNLLAHEPGLGKTVIAIELINRLKLKKVLVVCPASIKRNWMHKLKDWLVEDRVIQIVDKKTDFITEIAEVVIINYDLVVHSYLFKQLTDVFWDLVICDESHRLKNIKAKRTIAVLANNGLVRCTSRTLLMTGTPVLNRPVELYPILKVLAPIVIAPYSDYFRYAKRYCDAWEDGFGLNAKGASNLDELNKKLRLHYMERKMLYEVEVQLPKKRYEIVFIDSTKEVRNQLITIENASRKDFKHKNLGIGAGEIATLRRETAEQKLDVCIELIKEYVESAGKLVLFAYHHSIIERLVKELSYYRPVTFTGQTSQINREKAIERFQKSGECKVFIGQIQAAGEGIDGLQDTCSNVLFIEWSWVPGEIEQACKRVHRIGQTKPVLIRFLVWADSVEEHMMRIALDKVKVIKEILK